MLGTTRFESDVPLIYGSWAEYGFMEPRSEKVAGFVLFVCFALFCLLCLLCLFGGLSNNSSLANLDKILVRSA